jgi:hypothetical protein
MADFSLTTLFVVPVGSTLANSGSTQDLPAGKLGFYGTISGVPYTVLNAGNIASAPYFYVAQGRQNTYLQGSKRSDKIKGCATANCNSNVTEAYKITGCATAVNQITDITNFSAHCGESVTITLVSHSSYIDTLYFNGLTRSITVETPCCDCGADPCDTVDVPALINLLIAKFNQSAPGINPDNITFSDFFTFENIEDTTLRITAKALTKYGVPCDVAANPFEYDRMFFRAFIYTGPATTADFLVADNCNIAGDVNVIQKSNYPRGTSEEIIQMEKNYYSYQAGYLKHLFRMSGYNQNFESYVVPGTVYDTYYVKFNEFDRAAQNWGDFIKDDQAIMISVATNSSESNNIYDMLAAALGSQFGDDSSTCITTTSTTTAPAVAPTTTSTTTQPSASL